MVVVAKTIVVLLLTLTGALGAVCSTRPTLRLYSGYPSRGQGHLNSAVKELQAVLNQKNNARLTADGYFGQGTDIAVKNWQRRNGLTTDGVVGPRTWDSLCVSSCGRSNIQSYRLNQAGLDHLKQWEGSLSCPYQDVGGLWTVGVGHLCASGRRKSDCPFGGRCLSQAEIDSILRQDVVRFENRVKSQITVPLSRNEFAALVSFAYNLGSVLGQVLTETNSRRYHNVPSKMLAYNKVCSGTPRICRVVAGLTNRRRSEGDLWRKC